MATFRLVRNLQAATFGGDQNDRDTTDPATLKSWSSACQAKMASPASRAGAMLSSISIPHQVLRRVLLRAQDKVTKANSKQDGTAVISKVFSVMARVCSLSLDHLSSAAGDAVDVSMEEESYERDQDSAMVQDLLRECIFWCCHGLQTMEVRTTPLHMYASCIGVQDDYMCSTEPSPSCTLQKHVQANNVPSVAQHSCGWDKARAACLDALADFYTAAVLQPQYVMPAQHDRMAADEVRSGKLVLAAKLSASFLGAYNMLRSQSK
jgi:hypothetical protein